jgi:hypothetical protein
MEEQHATIIVAEVDLDWNRVIILDIYSRHTVVNAVFAPGAFTQTIAAQHFCVRIATWKTSIHLQFGYSNGAQSL